MEIIRRCACAHPLDHREPASRPDTVLEMLSQGKHTLAEILPEVGPEYPALAFSQTAR